MNKHSEITLHSCVKRSLASVKQFPTDLKKAEFKNPLKEDGSFVINFVIKGINLLEDFVKNEEMLDSVWTKFYILLYIQQVFIKLN